MGTRLIGAVLVVAVAAGCKPKAQTTSDGGSPRAFPARVGGGAGDASSLFKVGTLVAGGASVITLDLERLPSANNANIFACWPQPDAAVAVGRAVCTTDASQVVELTPGRLEFICSVDPKFTTVPTAQTIDLTACPAYDVFTYQFDAPLKVTLR